MLVTVGSVTGTARIAVDNLRLRGVKAGVLKLRFLRPFPDAEIRDILGNVKALGVMDKDISVGDIEGIYTELIEIADIGLVEDSTRVRYINMGVEIND